MSNICATLFNGVLDIDYTCVQSIECKYFLGEVMPPSPTDECASYRYGSCKCIDAQIAILKRLRRKITNEIKELEALLNE